MYMYHCITHVVKKIFISNVSHAIICGIRSVHECAKFFWLVVKLIKMHDCWAGTKSVVPFGGRWLVELRFPDEAENH